MKLKRSLREYIKLTSSTAADATRIPAILDAKNADWANARRLRLPALAKTAGQGVIM
jgi:hypothetical protein